MPERNITLEHARQYLALGWPVAACKAGSTDVLACIDSPTMADMERWLAIEPELNLALPCGRRSGILAIENTAPIQGQSVTIYGPGGQQLFLTGVPTIAIAPAVVQPWEIEARPVRMISLVRYPEGRQPTDSFSYKGNSVTFHGDGDVILLPPSRYRDEYEGEEFALTWQTGPVQPTQTLSAEWLPIIAEHGTRRAELTVSLAPVSDAAPMAVNEPVERTEPEPQEHTPNGSAETIEDTGPPSATEEQAGPVEGRGRLPYFRQVPKEILTRGYWQAMRPAVRIVFLVLLHAADRNTGTSFMRIGYQKAADPTNKTTLSYRANVSRSVCKLALKWLESHGLLFTYAMKEPEKEGRASYMNYRTYRRLQGAAWPWPQEPLPKGWRPAKGSNGRTMKRRSESDP